jgi:hypothetical protein
MKKMNSKILIFQYFLKCLSIMSGNIDFLPYVCGGKLLDALVYILNSFSDDNHDMNKRRHGSPVADR